MTTTTTTASSFQFTRPFQTDAAGVTSGGEVVNIRTATIDGEPWFVARDVCVAVGLSPNKGGYTHHLQRLGPDERGSTPRSGLGERAGMAFATVSESGLYKLVMRSDKPEARVFQDWVTREVLPAIRKTGGYVLNEASRETAHADKREAMPLPMDLAEALAANLKAQAETNAMLVRLMERLLDERVAPPAPPAPAPAAAPEEVPGGIRPLATNAMEVFVTRLRRRTLSQSGFSPARGIPLRA